GRQPDFTVRGGYVYLWGHLISWDLFDGQGLREVLSALARYETWISALAAPALLLLLRSVRRRSSLDEQQRSDLLVVLAYVVPYLAAIVLYRRTYQRFVLPLLPYACLLAAWTVLGTARGIGARFAGPRQRIAALLASCVLVLPQLGLALHLSWARTQPDTAT